MDVFDLFAKISLDTKGYDSGLKNAGDKLSTFGSKMGSAFGTVAKVGAAALTAATGATVAFGASAINAGKDFDSSMSQVAATMGKTTAEMEKEVGSVDTSFGKFNGTLRDFAQFMGSNTAFSATQAADALNYMALAGYNTQTSMEMLPNVLSLAAAGSMDLARASDMVTDTQTAFGISLDRTSQMVDEMAKAASTGNTSVEQLGDAFLVVGGLAKELNGGMITLSDGTKAEVDGVQELEIALTAMANAGVKGSEAGTHMRNMLLKLSSPTKDGTIALEQMGVKVFDAEGKMRSLSDVFGDLNKKLSTMTQEQKIQTIADLFNTRDMAAAEAMLAAVGQDWDKIGESILDAKGAAAQMADTQLDNLAGDVTLFKSALEGAQIAVSDKLTPSLRDFVKFGTKGLSDLTEAFKKDGLSGAMEVFGDLLSDGLKMFTEKLPEFVDAGIKLISALGQGMLDNIDVFVDAASEIIKKLSDALVEGLPDMIKGANELISKVLDAIIANLPQITPLIVDFIVGLAQIFADNIDKVIDVAITIAGAIGEGLIKAAPIIVEKIPDILKAIKEGFEKNPEALLTLGPVILGHIASGIGSNLGIIKKVSGVIGKAFDKVPLLNAAKTALSGVGSAIGQNMTVGLGAGFNGGAVTALGTAATTIAGSVAAIFGGMEIGKKVGGWIFPDDAELYEHYSGISGTFELIKDSFSALGDALGYGWEAIKEGAGNAWDEVQKSAKNTWEDVQRNAASAWADITKGAENVKSNVSKFFSEAKTNANNAWADAKSKFSTRWSEVQSAFSNVGNWFQTTFNTAKENASNAWSDVKSKFETRWKNVQSAFDGAGKWFETNFGTFKDNAVGAWDDIKSKFTTVFGNIKDAFNIGDAISWGRDLIANFISGIKSKAAALGDELKGVAEKVKKFLGFSEPEEGPLSDFHTYAPDMMELFAKGIKDNTDVVTDQIKKSFDFGDMITAETPSANGSGFNAGGITINLYPKDNQTASDIVNEIEYRIAKNVEAKKAVWAM